MVRILGKIFVKDMSQPMTRQLLMAQLMTSSLLVMMMRNRKNRGSGSRRTSQKCY